MYAKERGVRGTSPGRPALILSQGTLVAELHLKRVGVLHAGRDQGQLRLPNLERSHKHRTTWYGRRQER